MAEPTDSWYALFIPCSTWWSKRDEERSYSKPMSYRGIEAEVRSARTLGWDIILVSPTLIIMGPADYGFIWVYYPARQ